MGDALFGSLLREFRIHAGLSQSQLAESANMSLAAVSSLERGVRRAPQRQSFELLATALGLSAAQRAELEQAASLVKLRGRRRGAAADTVPTYLTSFVGRQADLAQLTALLERQRLVSVLGAGGIGKTRLACELAHSVQSSFAHVYYVDLSPLRDGNAVRSQLSLVTEADAASGDDPIEAIAAMLRAGRTLMVVDNCEHLLDELLPIVVTLLASVPRLTILATSRERLAAAGECAFRLEPLSTGWIDGQRPALQLFLERAAAADHRFRPDADASADALEICRRLDGLPLAIELTAARIGAFGLRGLRDRLDQQLFLPGAIRNGADRHATMGAAIAWSFDTLSPDERAVLCRVGIFRGGFTLEAAELVCSDEELPPSRILSIVTQLVDKSLIQMQQSAELPRYDVLVGVRLFSLGRLRESGEYLVLARRHARWLAEIADRSALEILVGTQNRPVVGRMRQDMENIRSALDRLLHSTEREDIVLAAKIAGGFRTMWIKRGLNEEGSELAVRVLSRLVLPDDDALASPVLKLLVQTASITSCEDAAERAGPVFERLGDDASLVNLAINQMSAYSEQHRFERANAVAQGVEAIFARNHDIDRDLQAHFLSNRCFVRAIQGKFVEAAMDDAAAAKLGSHASNPHRLYFRAVLEAEMGKYDSAGRFMEQCIERTDDVASMMRVQAKAFAATVAEASGDVARSRHMVAEALDSQEVRHATILLETVQASSFVAARLGKFTEAVKMVGFRRASCERLRCKPAPFIERMNVALEENLERTVGALPYRDLRFQGANLTGDEVIELARHTILVDVM